ncbi:hypothetical protein [Ilyobacter polytropus]|uniref:Uncharacterized protein n=1 Tax=Ilyobacter polytropus (strain ATCC 51220 / DSM 2926 / LMG 16218 / CuHBu1) TaxID=572544 RepID=E3HBQ7_ILYPC|nr:hypothetical protein [Ilyobacter polytropus]ADO83819.1 hypothetical protein Ilyop_2048 [Ilyobacter polytropus DSM 2926]
MANYNYMPDKFMPEQTKNAILHHWGFGESDFISKALQLENVAIAVIDAAVNLTVLKEGVNGPSLLSDLCTSYVGAKLFEQISNNDYEGYVDNLMTGFWDTIKEIKEAQEKASISPEEEPEKYAPGIMVF